MAERENPVALRILRMFNVFVLVFALRILEEVFLIIPTTRPDTKYAISSVVGVVLFFALLKLRGITNTRIGLNVPLLKLRKSFLIAVLISAISIFAGYMFDLICLKFTDNSMLIDLGFYYDKYSIGEYGVKLFAVAMMVCVFVSAASAVEVEGMFRGLITRTGRAVLPFGIVNVIQAILYSLFYSVHPIVLLIMGRRSFDMYMVRALLLYFALGFILGIAMGLLRRADGSLWLSIFTYFLISFLSSVLKTFSAENNRTLEMFRGRRLLAIYIAALILAFIYYRIRMKKRKKMIEEYNKNREKKEEEEETDEEYEYYDEDEELEKTVKSMNDKLKDASDKFDELD
ncbi:MAG: hypothetical protein K5756_00440 [Clostridiales bacterium]|nr:hypothetical protein [Clostridiales bacterium]